MTKANDDMIMTAEPAGLSKEIACCLRESFCTRLESSIEAEGTFVFPAGFPAFKGHFPAEPVLPGIVQLYAVRYLATSCLACELIPVESNHIKFNKLVSPGETIHLFLKLSALSEDYWESSFSYTGDNKKISSGIITFRK